MPPSLRLRQGGGGGLGRLVEAVGRVVGAATHTVEVVSVYSLQHSQRLRSRLETLLHTSTTEGAPHTLPATTTTTPKPATHPTDFPSVSSTRPSTCVWVSVREGRDRFMDPVKLQGLLGLHTYVVSHCL